jgi:hypothetical protein|tara:strand:- start:18 stop:518 length:501 start_codon:yes stop_codon:yes gene_type:complete
MNRNLPQLMDLTNNVKYFLSAFLVLMTIGVTVGLVYVFETTSMSAVGTEAHYAGSLITDELDIPEKYPKEFDGMLLTTHTHVISFAFIFFFLGGIFLMNSIITGGWKTFLIIEPFISVIGTFGSIWGIRYVSSIFSILTIIFGTLTYLSFYFMIGLILYELLFKNK